MKRLGSPARGAFRGKRAEQWSLVTKALCHHRRYEETSENEAAAEEEEEEEEEGEDVFAEKASPDRDEGPALKVGRTRETGRSVLGKQPSVPESRHSKKAPPALGDGPSEWGDLQKVV